MSSTMADRRGGAPQLGEGSAERLADDFSHECALISRASRKLRNSNHSLQSREALIQTMCNTVWTVVQQQYSVNGKCGDRQQYTVTHQYTQQVAVVDAAKLDALKNEMKAHLSSATRELGSALFEHTLAEERLSRFVLSRILSPERPPNPATLLKLLQQLIKMVTSLTTTAASTTATTTTTTTGGGGGAPLALSSSSPAPPSGSASPGGLDERTLPALRRLALALGTALLASRASPGAPADLEGTLLPLLYYGSGCGWAAPLLRPSVDDLVARRWMWQLLVNQPAAWRAGPRRQPFWPPPWRSVRW